MERRGGFPVGRVVLILDPCKGHDLGGEKSKEYHDLAGEESGPYRVTYDHVRSWGLKGTSTRREREEWKGEGGEVHVNGGNRV